MKNIVGVLCALFGTGCSLFAIIKELDPDYSALKTIKDELKEFAPPTTSDSESPWPNLAMFKQESRIFIAKVIKPQCTKAIKDELKTYVTFQTNEDIDIIVREVQLGQANRVQWYYFQAQEENEEKR